MHSSNHSSISNRDASPNSTKVMALLSKPTVKIALAVITLVITLIMINLNIIKYENHLVAGDKVLLELAPVDPRGFMQGDYMTLRFEVANQIRKQLKEEGISIWKINSQDRHHNNGYAIIKKDNNGVGQLVRLDKTNDFDQLSLQDGEMALFYRIRKGRIKFATNAFFFQEGHAKAYEAAKYGLFSVNQHGEPLLTKMVDKDFKIIVGDKGVQTTD